MFVRRVRVPVCCIGALRPLAIVALKVRSPSGSAVGETGYEVVELLASEGGETLRLWIGKHCDSSSARPDRRKVLSINIFFDMRFLYQHIGRVTIQAIRCV